MSPMLKNRRRATAIVTVASVVMALAGTGCRAVDAQAAAEPHRETT